MGMGRRRSSAALSGASPPIDSGTTSPDGAGVSALPNSEATTRSNEAGEVLPGDCGACAQPRPKGRCGGASKLRRGMGGGSKGEEPDGPAEVKMQHHGRGGGKESGWRSLHMVQCLRYHEVRCGAGLCLAVRCGAGRCGAERYEAEALGWFDAGFLTSTQITLPGWSREAILIGDGSFSMRQGPLLTLVH